MDLSDILNKVLCGEELTPEERQILTEILETDPDLLRSLDGWQQVRDYLRDRIPKPRDLVLYSLVSGGYAGDLDDAEASEISENWKELDSVVETHHGFSEVSTQIAQDRGDFLTHWELEEAQPIRRIPSWAYRMAAVVAILAICVVATVFLLNQRDHALQIAVATPGEYERVLLPDSSVVHLNGPATLQFNEQKFGRTVELTGKAFFEITHQPDQFTVQTGEAVTRVLGTRFSVRSHNDVTQVVLESGRVEVAAKSEKSQSVALLPGQMTNVTRGAFVPSPPTEVNIEDELLWTGFIFFRNTPMRKVVVILSASRGTRVEVDSSLINEAMTGTFAPDVATRDIVNDLALALNAEVFEEADTFRIVP